MLPIQNILRSSHLISSHLISSHLTSSHLISSHLISSPSIDTQVLQQLLEVLNQVCFCSPTPHSELRSDSRTQSHPVKTRMKQSWLSCLHEFSVFLTGWVQEPQGLSTFWSLPSVVSWTCTSLDFKVSPS